MQTVSTCLWFDDQAEEAVAFYTSLFPNSRIFDTKYHLEGAPHPATGSMLTMRKLDIAAMQRVYDGP